MSSPPFCIRRLRVTNFPSSLCSRSAQSSRFVTHPGRLAYAQLLKNFPMIFVLPRARYFFAAASVSFRRVRIAS
jgi:hypothetical protein